jgi:hypothetical protein
MTMAAKFDPIRDIIRSLEVAAAKTGKIKGNAVVTSQSDVVTQVTAVKDVFRRLKINKVVTAKVGLWRKRTPLVDVLIGYPEDLTARNGEEAFELSNLMLQAMTLTRIIIEKTIPGMTNYCPEVGAVLNGWRFQ